MKIPKWNSKILASLTPALAKVIGCYFSVVILLGLLYTLIPPVSTLMLARYLTGQKVQHEHVSLKNVNHNVLKAVIRAEDDKFCSHFGIDWQSMSSALKQVGDNERSFGASTISMQVAKNLFLWPQRSYVRKLLEIPIAMYIDLLWSKKHMMAIYLSIAEWGDGVFGIEAAAQTYFHIPANRLTAYQAALLAAALPNPLERNPNRPSAYHSQYANTIVKRMNNSTDLSCF